MTYPMPVSLSSTLLEALVAVDESHYQLGEDGKQFVVRPNQFGEQALRADVTAEQIIIDALHRWWEMTPAAPVVRVYSEEHGTVIIGDGDDVGITVWLDGLDGSKVYLESDLSDQDTMLRVGYGTTLALAMKDDDATYADICFSAVLRMPSHMLLYRISDVHNGATALWNFRNAHRVEVVASRASQLERESQILYADSCFEEVVRTFDEPLAAAGYETHYTGSTASNAFDIITGRPFVGPNRDGVAVALMEVFDKGNLEMTALYHLVTGAYGVMTTLDGRDIGPQTIQAFAQEDDRSTFFVMAANQYILGEILAIVNR